MISETGNLDDLAEKMILLTREKSLRQVLIKKGLLRAQDFSSQKFIDAFHHQIRK
jgi:hypothetical protein